jgi:transcription antitermination factor NusG
MTRSDTIAPAGNISCPAWFAVSVKPRHEKAVGRFLRERDLVQFVPLCRGRRAWSDRVKKVDLPLFAGYVFCRFSYADRLNVLSTPGVTGILGAGKVFSPISEEQIAALRTIVASGAPARPCDYLPPGQIVRVEDGPLAGVSGTVLRSHGSASIVISIEILQRSVAVELDVFSVKPARPAMRTAAAVI